LLNHIFKNDGSQNGMIAKKTLDCSSMCCIMLIARMRITKARDSKLHGVRFSLLKKKRFWNSNFGK